MLPLGWKSYRTPDGKEYYHHAATNVTQWERPLAPDSVYHPSVVDLNIQRDQNYPPSVPVNTFPSSDSETRHNANAHSTVQISSFLEFGADPSLGRALGGAVAQSLMGGVEHGSSSAISHSLFAQIQQMFDISDEDILRRLKFALLPWTQPERSASNDEFRVRPDFYGPFWIASTAVLFQAATANFARLLAGVYVIFRADYRLVSLAASLIYGCLLVVPAVTRWMLYCGGHTADRINFNQLICVYGYSLAPVIPVSMFCLIPSDWFRWLVVLGGLAISLLFIHSRLWNDFGAEAPQMKWSLIGGLCIAQVTIFLTYRFLFFREDEIKS